MNKTNLIVLCVGIFLGLCTGFFTGKALYDKPNVEKVERDTITIVDTIPQYFPVVRDSAIINYVTKYLPVLHTDTMTQWFTMHDTVAVEVPITSKHYSSQNYDAWVSGFEPSLDSIKVYQKETVITETITKVVKERKHFFLDVGAGCEYRFNDKAAVPFAELGLKFKTGRFGIGAYGGYSHDTNENKGLPNGRVKITYDIISF